MLSSILGKLRSKKFEQVAQFNLTGKDEKLYNKYGALAIDFANRGRLEDAIAQLSKILRKSKKCEFALLLKSTYMHTLVTQRLKEAGSFRGMQLPDAWKERRRLLSIKKDIESCLSVVNAALELNPNNEISRSLKAFIEENTIMLADSKLVALDKESAKLLARTLKERSKLGPVRPLKRVGSVILWAGREWKSENELIEQLARHKFDAEKLWEKLEQENRIREEMERLKKIELERKAREIAEKRFYGKIRKGRRLNADAAKAAMSALGSRCALCSATEQLVVHHKDGDRKNNALENLLVLCEACHRRVHA